MFGMFPHPSRPLLFVFDATASLVLQIKNLKSCGRRSWQKISAQTKHAYMRCDLALVTMSDFKNVESGSFTYPELVAKFVEKLVQSKITEGVIIPSGSLDVIESDDSWTTYQPVLSVRDVQFANHKFNARCKLLDPRQMSRTLLKKSGKFQKRVRSRSQHLSFLAEPACCRRRQLVPAGANWCQPAPTGAGRRQLVPAGANWCRPAPVGAGASWCRRRCAKISKKSVLSTGAGRRCLATPVPARVVQGVGACGKKLQQVCFALILPLGGEPCATGAGATVAKQWRPVSLLSALKKIAHVLHLILMCEFDSF